MKSKTSSTRAPLRTRPRRSSPPLPLLPPPATTDGVLELSQHFASGKAHIPDDLLAPWREELDKILGRLLPSPDPERELAAVTAAVEQCEQWTRFPRPVQRQLIGLTATRLRWLQDERKTHCGGVDRAFSRLTRFSKTHEPGFVFGLTRSHTSQHGSWAADADAWWEELTANLPPEESRVPDRGALLAEIEGTISEIELAPAAARAAVVTQVVGQVRQALQGGVRSNDPGLVRLATSLHDELEGREFKSLRRAILDARAVGEDKQEAPPVPPDWPCWGATRGKRAVLVGGSPRDQNRRRIQAAFQLAELTWQDTPDKPRALDGLKARIRGGRFDLVIMLGGFMGHNYDDVLLPACKEAGVSWVHVDHGYGVTAIRRAIERFVSPSS